MLCLLKPARPLAKQCSKFTAFAQKAHNTYLHAYVDANQPMYVPMLCV
jgi:hypothetical protein